jgi:hypothetical protein
MGVAGCFWAGVRPPKNTLPQIIEKIQFRRLIKIIDEFKPGTSTATGEMQAGNY